MYIKSILNNLEEGRCTANVLKRVDIRQMYYENVVERNVCKCVLNSAEEHLLRSVNILQIHSV